MQQFYQFDYRSAPWNTFRYIIKNNDIPFYQVRRTGFRKYRQFEDINNKILYYIGATKIKSIDNEQILANVQMNRKIIETIYGNFTLTNLDISNRSYILKMNDEIIAQIKRKGRSTRIIKMKDINEQYQSFIFALIILIDNVLERILSSITYGYSMHVFC
jgi:hypothetical protein